MIALGRPKLDLANPASIARALAAAAPDAVISAAAYTAVDKAETERDLAFAVNGAGAGAEAAKALGVPLVHVSTDYLFDGLADRPYVEATRPGRPACTAPPSWPASGRCWRRIRRTAQCCGWRGSTARSPAIS